MKLSEKFRNLLDTLLDENQLRVTVSTTVISTWRLEAERLERRLQKAEAQAQQAEAQAAALMEALRAADDAFEALNRWIGNGMITGHRARVLRLLGDAPERVKAALGGGNAPP